MFLRPGEYWSFPAARYDGPFATTLRFALMYGSGTKSILVSNTFEGGIDPAQFTERQPYRPTGIMAP
ncbi:MAG: hypothetical protein R6V58_11940 [Planctomycetota bacterium]